MFHPRPESVLQVYRMSRMPWNEALRQLERAGAKKKELPAVIAKRRKINQDFSEKKKKVIAVIRDNPGIVISAICRLLGGSGEVVGRICRELIQEGIATSTLGHNSVRYFNLVEGDN